MSNLLFPYRNVPNPGEIAVVEQGVIWIRMPLPFKLNHINLWLIPDGEDYCLLDTGMHNSETIDLWDILLNGPLKGKKISKIISTHFHPDHMGLAGYLVPRLQAEFYANREEWLYSRMLAQDDLPDLTDTIVEFYRLAGFAEEALADIRLRGNAYKSRALPPPPDFLNLKDGFRVGDKAWEVIEGQGHSPQHASLYCREAKLLFSGDQILPKISPIVGVWPQEPEANPLKLFMDSLALFENISDDVLILPSHGLPFQGINARIHELREHHKLRLDETRDACQKPATALEVAKKLFPRELDAHETVFATGETIAHLNYLLKQKLIKRNCENRVHIYSI